MYRTAIKRLILHSSYANNVHRQLLLPTITTTTTTISSRFFSTESSPPPLSHQNPSPLQPPPPPPQPQPETLDSATTTTTAAEEKESFRHDNQSSRGERRGERIEYQEEQVRVLQAALRHVIRLGWSEAAMISGAKEVGVSPSIIGSFPRKEAALVEFFMDDCLQRLMDIIDSGEDLRNLIHSDRIVKLVRIRLEMQAPYISKWPQALSIQALPVNIPTSFKQRALLIDEIWHASGDQASDIDWYVKRTILGGIYSATEVYMLTDNSPDFRDTWKFLDHRVKDAFDFEKTVQEVKHLAEAVGSGIGSTLQGILRGVSRR